MDRIGRVVVPRLGRPEICFENGRICHNAGMTGDQVKAMLDRVVTWPPERRADVAHVVELMEEQDRSELRLTDEQVAEVRRRLANPSNETIPAEDAFKRFRSRRT